MRYAFLALALAAGCAQLDPGVTASAIKEAPPASVLQRFVGSWASDTALFTISPAADDLSARLAYDGNLVDFVDPKYTHWGPGSVKYDDLHITFADASGKHGVDRSTVTVTLIAPDSTDAPALDLTSSFPVGVIFRLVNPCVLSEIGCVDQL